MIDTFEGIPLTHINQLVIYRDKLGLIVRIELNNELLLESGFWVITSRSLQCGDFANLPEFRNLREFIGVLIQYILKHSVAKKVNVRYEEYDFNDVRSKEK